MNYAMSAESSAATNKKRFLITGYTGFVGCAMAEKLWKEGHEVVALIRSSNGREADTLDVVPKECYESIKFVYGDLTDYISLEKALLGDFAETQRPLDGCFHLASQSHPPTGFLDPIGTLNTNLIGSANLFDVIEKLYSTHCKIMACSTSEVYGNSGADGRLLKESDPLAPSNPYATGKAAMDLHLQERIANGKNSGFITRSFSHTGKRRGKAFSISSDAYQIASFMIKEKEAGYNNVENFYQLKVGNLETTRVVLSVEDVVEAYYLLMMNDGSNGRVFNICGDIPRKMEWFTNELIKLSGLNVEKVIDKNLYRKHDIFYQHGCTESLRSLTGWAPKIPIEQTLSELLNYWIKKLQE